MDDIADSGLFDATLQRSDEEYPLISNKQLSRIEAKALKEGWVQLIDDNAENLVKNQLIDAMDRESKPRDRRGAFAALMKAKTDHETRNAKSDVNVNIQNNEGAQVRITLPDNGRSNG